MSRLFNAFSHLLPILEEPTDSYIPIANSTGLEATEDDLDTAFLSNVIRESSRILHESEETSSSAAFNLSDEEDPSDNNVVISALTFYSGRKRGQQCRWRSSLHTRTSAGTLEFI